MIYIECGDFGKVGIEHRTRMSPGKDDLSSKTQLLLWT